MLSKPQLMSMLVGLASGGDLAVAKEDRCLTEEVCAADDRDAVREVAGAVDRLLKQFSYARSPEFGRGLAGKPSSVVAMRRKLAEDPVRRSENHARFARTLAVLLSSDEAYELLPGEEHVVLDRVRRIVRSFRNPDG